MGLVLFLNAQDLDEPRSSLILSTVKIEDKTSG